MAQKNPDATSREFRATEDTIRCPLCGEEHEHEEIAILGDDLSDRFNLWSGWIFECKGCHRTISVYPVVLVAEYLPEVDEEDPE